MRTSEARSREAFRRPPDARGRRSRDPSDPPRRGRARGLVRRMRTRTSAEAISARNSRHTCWRSSGCRSSARAGGGHGAAAMDELLAYSERVVRGEFRELPDGRYEGADAVETPDGLARIRAVVDDRGRLGRDRLRGNRAPAPRESQLPARCHPFRLLLRRALPDRTRSPRLWRRVRSGHGACARRVPRERSVPRSRGRW